MKYNPKIENPENLPPAGISTEEQKELERARSKPKTKRHYAVIEVDIGESSRQNKPNVVYVENELKNRNDVYQGQSFDTRITKSTQKKNLKPSGISMEPAMASFGLNKAY
jgi:hypothetical protein